MSTNEWSSLMAAPWGKHTPDAIRMKTASLNAYTEATRAFWQRRNRAVPTLPNDDRRSDAVTPIENWVPRLAPAFAEMKGDIRAAGRLG